MYEQFIEFTDQIFWEGYAEQLANDDPARFMEELNDFIHIYQSRTMEDKIFLLVKVTIKTNYPLFSSAIKELQSKTDLRVSSTANVQVLKTEIMQLNTNNR